MHVYSTYYKLYYSECMLYNWHACACHMNGYRYYNYVLKYYTWKTVNALTSDPTSSLTENFTVIGSVFPSGMT